VLCILAETTGQVAAERSREQAEAALRAERDRSQGVLDNMGEAFVLLDREFRIVDMNAEAMRLEKRPKEDILGKTHWEAHPDAAPELGELFRQGMRERRPVSMEHRYVWPDGRDTWIDTRVYPAGEGLAVFYRDATERKRAEAAVRASDDRQRFLIALADEVRGLADPGAVVAATSRPWASGSAPRGSPMPRSTRQATAPRSEAAGRTARSRRCRRSSGSATLARR
jgi:PAS domain S-box-containing protein